MKIKDSLRTKKSQMISGYGEIVIELLEEFINMQFQSIHQFDLYSAIVLQVSFRMLKNIKYKYYKSIQCIDL